MRLSTCDKLCLSHFLAIVLVAGSISTYFYASAANDLRRNMQSRLINTATLLSNMFTSSQLDTLTTADNMANASFASFASFNALNTLLHDYADANSDIALIYILRKQDEKAVFVLGSSPDKAVMTGQTLDTITPELMRGFQQVSIGNPTDPEKSTGLFSAYAPLYGSNGRYLLGIKMSRQDVQQKTAQYQQIGIITLVLSFMLALLLSSLLTRHFNRRINRLTNRCAEIANATLNTGTAEKGDKLNQLGLAIEAMARHINNSQTENETARQALQTSKSNLETRVKQRTQDLLKTSDKLRQEIKDREQIESVLQKSALTDSLTGLPDRRAMVQLLNKEAARYRRSGCPFSLVLLDIDNFKRINDTYSHDGGNEILVTVAKNIVAWMRGQDILARWGGEEFLILLNDTNVDSASDQAERLRTAIETQDFNVCSQVTHLTVSLGVAGYSEHDGLEGCIKNVDIALYQAKAGGRNQVVTHTSMNAPTC